MSNDVANSKSDKKFYLRSQGWCHCQRSFDMAGGKFEQAVSVYDCVSAGDGKWTGQGPGWEKRERLMSNRPPAELGAGTWYLVSGNECGFGADGEPLIKDVVAQKAVLWDGAQCFVETGPPASPQPWEDHPAYPDCTCVSVDDLLKLT
jgi:hypothetical protein